MMMKKEMLLKKQVEYNSFDDADIKNIIFGVDANYIKYAAGTMLSIIKHRFAEDKAYDRRKSANFYNYILFIQ